MHHHHRNYPYDNSSTTYGQPQLPLPQTGSYSIPNHQNVYDDHNGTRPCYNQIHPGMNTTDEQNSQCYQNAPPMQHDSRYPNPNNTGYYQGQQASSSTHYGTPSYYYNHSVQRNQQPHANPHFIPTPSELSQISRQHGASQTPGHSPELTSTDYGIPHVLPPPMRLPPATARPRTGSGGSPTTTNGERFPCEKCGKTFSRSHDRKRHHETQHLPTPVIHRCRYCEKEFSRSDSLKRHVDNGCDEMP